MRICVDSSAGSLLSIPECTRVVVPAETPLFLGFPPFLAAAGLRCPGGQLTGCVLALLRAPRAPHTYTKLLSTILHHRCCPIISTGSATSGSPGNQTRGEALIFLRLAGSSGLLRSNTRDVARTHVPSGNTQSRGPRSTTAAVGACFLRFFARRLFPECGRRHVMLMTQCTIKGENDNNGRRIA